MDLYVIQMFHLNLMFHGNTKAIPGNMRIIGGILVQTADTAAGQYHIL